MLIFMLLLFAEPVTLRHQVQPFDIQNPEKGALFNGVRHVITTDHQLLIAPVSDPEILVFSLDGTFRKILEKQGDGPTEFGSSVYGFGADQNALVVVGSKPRAHVFEIQSFQHLESTPLESFNVQFYLPPNYLAVNSEKAVFVAPAYPRSGALGIAYSFDGRVLKKVGKPLDIPEAKFLSNNGYGDTLWAFGEDRWFCVFKHIPRIEVFNAQFKNIATYDLTGPFIERAVEESKKAVGPPAPVVQDIKVHQGKIYVLTQLALLELDLDGTHEKTHVFYGVGPEFAMVGDSYLNFFSFAVQGERFYLAHPAMMWDHDMFVVDLSGEGGTL